MSDILNDPCRIAPWVDPLDREWTILWELIDRLHQLGYTDLSASQTMDTEHISRRDMRKWPAHLRGCHRSNDPLSILTAFFLVEDWVERQTLVDILGEPLVKLMHNLRWLRKDGSKLNFAHFLFPNNGRYILTDGSVHEEVSLNQVYYLGSDSYLLSWLTPRRRVQYTLDHCTGSGIHALLASFHAQASFGLDINPRALNFSRFNAKFNQANNVLYLRSDCYENVVPEKLGLPEGSRFDLITANPPFVPTPDTMALCRGGGITGEEVTEKIVAGLPTYLSDQGLFSMITNVPIFKDSTFFERCEKWLGSKNYAMICLNCHYWSLADYAISHLRSARSDGSAAEIGRWIDAYSAAGLVSVSYSQVYLFPYDGPQPWRIDRMFGVMREDHGYFIELWIESLRRFRAQVGQPVRLRLFPLLGDVLWVEGRQKVFVHMKPEESWWWPVGVWLTGLKAQLLEKIQNGDLHSVDSAEELAALRELLAEAVIEAIPEP